MEAFSAAVNAGMLVLIWLVQIIVYPGMHGWEKTIFGQLHRRYCRDISLIVGPLLVAQIVLSVLHYAHVQDAPAAAQLCLVGAALLATAFVSVPLHRRLQAGYDGGLVARLVRTNWLRTICWSLTATLDWLP